MLGFARPTVCPRRVRLFWPKPAQLTACIAAPASSPRAQRWRAHGPLSELPHAPGRPMRSDVHACDSLQRKRYAARPRGTLAYPPSLRALWFARQRRLGLAAPPRHRQAVNGVGRHCVVRALFAAPPPLYSFHRLLWQREKDSAAPSTADGGGAPDGGAVAIPFVGCAFPLW